MTSLKLKFRPSRVEGKAGTLYIRVIHSRVVRQIALGFKIYPDEWANGLVQAGRQDAERRRYLQRVLDFVKLSLTRLGAIARQLEQSGGEYTADQVVELFRQSGGADRLCVFATQVARRLRSIGKVRLAEAYASATNSFMRFRGEQGDIRLDAMDADMVKDYEHYLFDECGLKPNSVSFYMRNLRALYNRAVDKGLTPDRHPFKHVYTGMARTVKRAVSTETIRRIRALDLSADPQMALARDVFLLSFFLRGMSFVDLSQLRTSSIQGGYLHYRRQKTNQALEIKWERRMQEIVSRYHVDGSPYLMPIVANPCGNVRRQYINALHRVNARLKRIGRMVDCPIRLTTYCARHAWASTARNMNVPLPVISEAMGHESEKTTRIYLSSLDSRLIDEANLKVISAV